MSTICIISCTEAGGDSGRECTTRTGAGGAASEVSVVAPRARPVTRQYSTAGGGAGASAEPGRTLAPPTASTFLTGYLSTLDTPLIHITIQYDLIHYFIL